jgi:hypothetical protein
MSTELVQNIFSKDREIHVLVHHLINYQLEQDQHQYQLQEHVNE